MKTMHRICTLLMLLSLAFTWVSCTDDTLDVENPDVDLFVKQLKDGALAVNEETGTVIMPQFTVDDIESLLNYAEDLSEIPSFPLAPVSYLAGGKPRLGECVLWVIESIRLGHNASLGCRMVRNDAVNYEGIYFLTDEQVLDAAAFYRRWWTNEQHAGGFSVLDTAAEPLAGSDYRWW
ncbi:MAG: DUF4943 domain-containing protein [Bacteroidaceae bacterium]|nr:DUF4943 domain-containing protein [Bacteroidaceae bacterium]